LNTAQDMEELEQLDLGHGSVEMEVFVEPTCPFSKVAFGKLQPLLDAVGEDKLIVRVRFVSQPWHLFSGIATRTILAATAAGGKQAGFKAMAEIYDRREEFEFEDHCSGPNMDRTPAQIIAQISDLISADLSEAFRLPAVGQALRWHTRYSRQNGIHFSPTFAVDRIVNNKMSSGQSIKEWSEEIRLAAR
jgi:hypothetical protein